MEKKWLSHPCRELRAISPLPEYVMRASATRVEGTLLSGPISAWRISPSTAIFSSPRLSVSSFWPRTSIVPLGKIFATVTEIEPLSWFDWAAAPLPAKLPDPLADASVGAKKEAGPVVGGVRPTLPERSVDA